MENSGSEIELGTQKITYHINILGPNNNNNNKITYNEAYRTAKSRPATYTYITNVMYNVMYNDT